MALEKVVISLAKEICLVNLDTETLHLLQSDPDRFCTEHGVSIGNNTAILLDVVAQTTKLMTKVGGDPTWFGYLTIDKTAEKIVGTCAFKGPPGKEGSVEIAYFTFPEFESKGYATAMASALIEIAWTSPNVERIIAHTLPETNASSKILQRIGMTFVGDIMDPEDGRVWRWALDRAGQT
jgi:[ribosomal protein S5]-alanine N-acetyltransferase